MDVVKPDFDFSNKVRLYERAEMIRIDELIDNFEWIQKLSVHLRVIGQGFVKNLQKALLKSRNPPSPDLLPFECAPYVKSLEDFISAVNTLNTGLVSTVANLAQSFQERVVKPFRTVSGCMTKLDKERQGILLKKRQYDDLDFDILNMKLGSSGNKMVKAISQTTAKMQKLKRSWEVDETAYKEHMANQHASLEKIDWTTMSLIAELTSCVGDYFIKLNAEVSSLSAALDQRAKSDKSVSIMEAFAAYVASLPDPLMQAEGGLESPRSPENSYPVTTSHPPQVNADKSQIPREQLEDVSNQFQIESANEQPADSALPVDQEA